MKSIDDVMICPRCGSNKCYEFSTDEIFFDYDNTGHYYTDCQCEHCNNTFRLNIEFKYEITNSSIRK